MPNVAIVDCGISNLTSVKNAFDFLGIQADVTRAPDAMAAATHLVLPGVGSFSRGMKNLTDAGLADVILREVEGGKPLLGLCLGMQLLAEQGDEYGQTTGLGLVRGRVARLQPGPDYRVPHVGWNDVTQIRKHEIWRDIEDSAAFYFVHSYAYTEIIEEDVLGACDYGARVVSAIARDNVMGVQFHPEKSQKPGLQLLKNFVQLC